jgi:hypothetical protein
MGLMAEESVFDSGQGQEIFLHNFQTGCEAHPVYTKMGKRGCFSRGKAAEARS